METNEHKDAGDKIRIETLKNPYLQGSKSLETDSSNNLRLRIMQKIDDVPVPLALELSAGDVVALAGDYYTKAGWWSQLKTPNTARQNSEENEQLLNARVTAIETDAFRQAYDNLASPSVTQQAIQRIYAIDESRLIPSLLKQLLYTVVVKDYGAKLSSNEDHFSPWSLRGYIVGHYSALRMAEIAFYCHKIAQGEIGKEDGQIPKNVRNTLEKVLKKIEKDPGKYELREKNEKEILSELGHRYHALALARDLFAMHFYSDHFAGGHLSRLGTMREQLPREFGVWGGILVNNMHNEDNEKGVMVTNSFQPPHSEEGHFQMLKEDCKAYGDGTYFNHGNDENSNLLINGMDNSLGDIARLMITGERRRSFDYGGITFLPAIDYSKRQTQPLFILGPDQRIYFRSNLQQIKIVSPGEYEKTTQDPSHYGYEKLTPWKAFLLVLKLRILAPFYASKVEPLTQKRCIEIQEDEKLCTDKMRLQRALRRQPNLTSVSARETKPLKIGQWRHNSIPTHSIIAEYGLLAQGNKKQLINKPKEISHPMDLKATSFF